MNPMWRENNSQLDDPMWKQILGGILIAIFMVFMAWIAGALQEHYECLNGRTEVCIPSDFE